MRTQIKTILVPIDFSGKSKNALKVAANMARRHEAKLLVTHVVHTYNLIDHGGKQVIGSQTVQRNIDDAVIKLEELRLQLNEEFKVEVETRISTQNMIDTVNDFITTEDIDIVVVGTSGSQNVKQLILGSNSYNMLLHANCSVLLVPEKFDKTCFKKILFPVRVKHELDQKADLSVLLADKNEGDISLLGVGTPNKVAKVRKAFMEMKKNLLLKSADYISEFHLSDNNADSIVKAANEKGSDIIILADQDEDSWKSFMADNFFKKIINGTDVPLLIVKSKLKKIKNDPETATGYDISLPIPG